MTAELVSYSLTFIIITVIVVYGIGLPYLISGQEALVKEYYKDHWMFYLTLDFFLVALYLFLAESLANRLGYKKFYEKLLILWAVTIAISGGFWLFFSMRTMTSSFFSRWFHKAGVGAVVYDLVLLTLMYVLYHQGLRIMQSDRQ